MKLALTYNAKKEATGGQKEDHYAEWDDMDTIHGVRDALLERHEEVELIEADGDAYRKLEASRPELVFNIAEGISGEMRESQIPTILDILGIPYTGSAPLTLALCLNKSRTKQVLSHSNVATPDFCVIDDAGKLNSKIPGGLKLPLIVKPLYEGSSKGIKDDSIVSSMDELKKKVSFVTSEYSQPALVEEFIDGREFTVAVIGNGSDIKAMPVVEINFDCFPEGVNRIYSYEAKWILDRPENPLDIFTCPADIDKKLESEVVGIAIDAFRTMEVRDWCRIDVRLDGDGKANIIELNPLPGVLPDPSQNSCFPKAARAAGMNFSELINSVVDAARKRYGI